MQLVQLSDIHVGSFFKQQVFDTVVEEVNKLNPDSVKVEVVRQSIENGEEKSNRQQQQQQQQPKAITMAEQLKHKASLDKKTKLGDGSNIKAEDRS